MKNDQSPFRLLPGSCKFVAFGIMVLTVIFFLLVAFDRIIMERDIIFAITKTGLLISLLMLTLTRHKREDEVISEIRLKAIALTFIFGVVYVIVEPFVSLIFQDGFISDMGVGQLMITLFSFYFIIFYFMLKRTQ